MVYTVMGFNQEGLVELGLTLDHAIILRWFVDFFGTGKMRKMTIDGRDYAWLDYETISEAYPIMKGGKRTIKRRIDDLVEKGVLIRHIEKQNFSYFALNDEKYLPLCDSEKAMTKDADVYKKLYPRIQKIVPTYTKNCIRNINSSINNSSIKLKNTPNPSSVIDSNEANSPSKLSLHESKEMFDKIWKAYPKSTKVSKCLYAFRQRCFDIETFNLMMAAIEDQKKTIWINTEARFIPELYKWLEDERWMDDVKNINTSNNQKTIGNSDKWDKVARNEINK